MIKHTLVYFKHLNDRKPFAPATTHLRIPVFAQSTPSSGASSVLRLYVAKLPHEALNGDSVRSMAALTKGVIL